MKDEQISVIQEQGDLGLGVYDLSDEEQESVEASKAISNKK